MSAGFIVCRSLSEVPHNFGPCALTIGNFDGVHTGHQALMKRVVEIAKSRGWRSAALTFDPHPTQVVTPAKCPKLLTTIDERCALIRDTGIDQVMVLPFDGAVASLDPEAFVRKVVHEGLHAGSVLVGDNFRFGAKAAGDTTALRALGEQFGFDVEIYPAVRCRRRVVSSTEVRGLVAAGDMVFAWRMLGRPYALTGRVVSGRGIGSKQTVPTLNLETGAEVIPARGVYVTRTHADNRAWPSVTNVGYRPTFDGEGLTIETFLLEPLEGGTPQDIRVEFLYRLRDERKFESPDSLKAQIFRDVARAKKFLRRVKA